MSYSGCNFVSNREQAALNAAFTPPANPYPNFVIKALHLQSLYHYCTSINNTIATSYSPPVSPAKEPTLEV